jgi:hypothetical protein
MNKLQNGSMEVMKKSFKKILQVISYIITLLLGGAAGAAM